MGIAGLIVGLLGCFLGLIPVAGPVIAGILGLVAAILSSKAISKAHIDNHPFAAALVGAILSIIALGGGFHFSLF